MGAGGCDASGYPADQEEKEVAASSFVMSGLGAASTRARHGRFRANFRCRVARAHWGSGFRPESFVTGAAYACVVHFRPKEEPRVRCEQTLGIADVLVRCSAKEVVAMSAPTPRTSSNGCARHLDRHGRF